MKKIIIYVLGTSRCGSTVFGDYLNQYENVIHVGELRFIWDRGYLENRLCNDGMQFLENIFWKKVSKKAFGNDISENFINNIFENSERTRFKKNGGLPLRKRHLILRSKNKINETIKKGFKSYEYYLNKLYNAIFDISKKSIIVDTSKEPIYGLILGNLNSFEVFYVHMIRDSRSVVNSQINNRMRNIISDNSFRIMGAGKNTLNSTTEWLKNNFYIDKFYSKNVRYLKIRFEDFVQEPVDYINILSKKINQKIENINEKNIKNVVFSGNPSRFKIGRISLNYEEKWQKQLKIYQKIITKIITYPLMYKYGYFNK